MSVLNTIIGYHFEPTSMLREDGKWYPGSKCSSDIGGQMHFVNWIEWDLPFNSEESAMREAVILNKQRMSFDKIPLYSAISMLNGHRGYRP